MPPLRVSVNIPIKHVNLSGCGGVYIPPLGGRSKDPTENTFGGDPKKENYVLITRRTRSACYVFFAPSPTYGNASNPLKRQTCNSNFNRLHVPRGNVEPPPSLRAFLPRAEWSNVLPKCGTNAIPLQEFLISHSRNRAENGTN